jgi:hypothetical protein
MAVLPPETAVPQRLRAAAGKPSPFDFVGRMTAVVAILPVAPDTARAMLPAGLDLAAQDLTPGERHPLVLIMGQQSDVRPRVLPLGADYLEFILAVPFVERPERGAPRGPFGYCPRLFLDRHVPIIAGRLLYGYAKRRALIRMTAASYSIAEPGGADRLLEAHFRITERPLEAPWGGTATLFDLPVISRAAGTWWYSCADFGLERALVQPVELRLTIHRPFVSGLPVGQFAMAGIGGVSHAFRIRTEWRLAGPWARRSP